MLGMAVEWENSSRNMPALFVQASAYIRFATIPLVKAAPWLSTELEREGTTSNIHRRREDDTDVISNHSGPGHITEPVVVLSEPPVRLD